MHEQLSTVMDERVIGLFSADDVGLRARNRGRICLERVEADIVRELIQRARRAFAGVEAPSQLAVDDSDTSIGDLAKIRGVARVIIPQAQGPYNLEIASKSVFSFYERPFRLVAEPEGSVECATPPRADLRSLVVQGLDGLFDGTAQGAIKILSNFEAIRDKYDAVLDAATQSSSLEPAASDQPRRELEKAVCELYRLLPWTLKERLTLLTRYDRPQDDIDQPAEEIDAPIRPPAAPLGSDLVGDVLEALPEGANLMAVERKHDHLVYFERCRRADLALDISALKALEGQYAAPHYDCAVTNARSEEEFLAYFPHYQACAAASAPPPRDGAHR